MKIYKTLSLVLMVLFAVTGMLFLFIPDGVFNLFNSLSANLGMTPSPVAGSNFYLVLAAGYMYLVTVLAFLMFRHPGNRVYLLLLTHAKFASSVLSLVFFFQADYLVYLANFLVDGVIGAIVLTMYLKAGRSQWASS
jgi:hypothetical protein